MWRITGPIISLVLLLTLVAGCGLPGVEVVDSPPDTASIPALASAAPSPEAIARRSPSPARASAAPSPQATARASTVPSPSASLAGTAAGGDMALVLGQRSLSALSDGSWRAITLPVGGNRCQDGRAVFGATGGLISCAGRVFDESRSWAPRSELFNRGQLFAAPDGSVWAWGSSGAKLVAVDGSVSTPKIGIREPSYDVVAAAFAPDGGALFAQRDGSGRRNQLLAFDGRFWRGYGRELGMDKGDFPAAMLQTARGEVLAGDSRLYSFVDDHFVELLAPEAFRTAFGPAWPAGADGQDAKIRIVALAETPDGTVWIATRDAGLFSWDGDMLRAWDTQDGLAVSRIDGLAVDGDGTLWVATAFGLAQRAGDGFFIALPGTGGPADSAIQAVAVRGAPLLPPPGRPRVASLAGSIVRNGAPLAGALVELCAEPPVSTGGAESAPTPCAGQAFQRATVTDADGGYSFSEVPLATYVLVVVPAGGAPQTADSAVTMLREGAHSWRNVELKIEN